MRSLSPHVLTNSFHVCAKILLFSPFRLSPLSHLMTEQMYERLHIHCRRLAHHPFRLLRSYPALFVTLVSSVSRYFFLSYGELTKGTTSRLLG